MRHRIMHHAGAHGRGMIALTVVLRPPPKVASADDVLCEEANYRPGNVIQRACGWYPACTVDDHGDAGGGSLWLVERDVDAPRMGPT